MVCDDNFILTKKEKSFLLNCECSVGVSYNFDNLKEPLVAW